MLFFSIWPDRGDFPVDPAAPDTLYTAGFDALRYEARYSRDEIVAALDHAGTQRRADSFREGVLFSEPWQSDVFLVTLRKSERDYSPTTMYNLSLVTVPASSATRHADLRRYARAGPI